MIRKPISAKPISHFSLLSTKYSSSSNPPKFLLFRVSHFTSSSSPNSSGVSSPTTSYPSRRHEEESRNVRVSVWWDFENCHVPVAANVFRVAQCVTAAVRANGIKGPIQITAFGDVLQMSRQNQEALSSTGINLTHIPRGGKNSADRSLLIDLMYWVSQNPPPAHLFLISGDRDFAGILHRLRMNNYNILLASSENAPSVLCSAASIMWHWNSLLKGENLSGRHFNQPPDGPYGSWYGHYKAPLEDPYTVAEQSACTQPPVKEQPTCYRAPVTEQSACPQSEDLTDSVLENKQPIPKTVIKQIRNILNQYPKGISITELRSKLAKSNLSIDKDFYGHKKFSKFLLAMPHILKLQSRNDGQFFVRSVTQRINEQVDLSPSSSITRDLASGEVDSVVAAKLNAEKGSCADQLDVKLSRPPSSGRLFKNAGKEQDHLTTIQKPTEPSSLEQIVKSPSIELKEQPTKEVQESPREVREQPEVITVTGDAKATESQLCTIGQSPVSEVGLFKRIWRKWFGKKDSVREESVVRSNDVISDEKMKREGKGVKSSVESVPENSTSRICEPSDEEMKTQHSGSFRSFLKKLFWGSSVNPDNSGEFREKMNIPELVSYRKEIFGKDSFWDELKTFLDTPKASATIMQSRTRNSPCHYGMQMMQDLQKEGPPVLSSLSEAELLHLVELLIFGKKLIDESPTEKYPFKFVRSEEKSSSSISHQPNGLSSLFSKAHPQSLSQRLRELDGQKKHPNPPDTAVSEPAVESVLSHKSRNEILADCQKLLEEIVEKYPEGFNIGRFRKIFSERYGYPLDLQKLGYQKLATLLQIMPGVRMESTYIFPAGNLPESPSLDSGDMQTHSESLLSDASGKEDDGDSPWEELGPLADSSSNKNERGPATKKSLKDETFERLDHDYESLSEDYLTDSEEESSLSAKSESRNKPRTNEEDSSLLQVLDSWYSTKDDNIRKHASGNPDKGADSSENGSRVSSSGRSIASNETPVISNARKQKPLKSYSFVQDQAGGSRDRLIDGILGSLKKSGGKSVETRI